MESTVLRKINYDEISDDDLVMLAQAGNSAALEYLFYRYKNIIGAKAKTYFLIGADREDIIQEGMIGLYKAIRDYNKDRLSSFKAFAELCVTRQIITAIKTATRQKHIPLNTYVSLNKPIYEQDKEKTLFDVIALPEVLDPETMFITKETYADFEVKMEERLSRFERKVMSYYLEGKSYHDIARLLNKSAKSVDNALQRVKRKLSHTVEF